MFKNILRLLLVIMIIQKLGNSDYSDPLGTMIKFNSNQIIHMYYPPDIDIKQILPQLHQNRITILELLECGAYGCVFKVCYKSNCDVAMKLGQIADEEIETYKKASDLRLVPYFYANFTFSLQNYSGTSKNPSTNTVNHDNIGVMLTDLYPMSAYNFLKLNYCFTNNAKHKILRFLPRLRDKALNHNFYHHDLHLSNIMVGSDLINLDDLVLDDLYMDEQYIPVVLIDVSASTFQPNARQKILMEWADIIYTIKNQRFADA